MAIIDFKPELEEMVKQIAARNTYYGNRIPASIMKMFHVETKDDGSGGIMVPYWIGVLEKGRGPRKSKTDHNLKEKIYNWMMKRSMFHSKTEKGRRAEAKAMTWYINKYGNQQFREDKFVDVYTTVRKNMMEQIRKKAAPTMRKITMQIMP